MPNSELVQSVVRALEIVRYTVESSQGLHLNDIVQKCNLKPPTAHNLLRTLVHCGYISKAGDGRYIGGPALYELSRTQENNHILQKAEVVLPKLALQFPTAILTLSYMGIDSIRRLLRMSPDRKHQLQRPLEGTFPPYLSATSVCLQATAVNAQIFEQNWPFEDYGLTYWKSHEHFLKAKASVQKNGYYKIARGTGFGIAFAVPDNYALGISFQEMPECGLEAVKKAMREAVKTVTYDTGVKS